jgi:hypothetical protein
VTGYQRSAADQHSQHNARSHSCGEMRHDMLP